MTTPLSPAATIRRIEPRDNPLLARIIRAALEEFGANKAGTVYFDASTDQLYELFQVAGATYLVAEVDAEVVGGAGIYPTEGLPAGTCELVKMYLSPGARGRGLGGQLIRRCLHWARQAGYRQVYLETMPELRQALRTYEHFGFRYLPAPMGQSGHFGCDRWMLLELQ